MKLIFVFSVQKESRETVKQDGNNTVLSNTHILSHSTNAIILRSQHQLWFMEKRNANSIWHGS